MNSYKARQRKDKKWDYTCKHDGYVWPVGYCADFRAWTEQDEIKYGKNPDAALAESFKHRHHCEGHGTEEEACECFRQFMLDQRLGFRDDIENPEELHRCKAPGCNEMTSGEGSCDYSHWWLCKSHRNRETVDKLLPIIGWICSS